MSEAKKSVIITGSSSGFGLKAVKDFADKGYQVFATMRGTEGKNAAVKTALEAYSNLIHVVDMDVTSDESVKTAIAGVLAKAGKIDILINNAGVMYLGITEAFSIAQAREQMETNYYGAMRIIQAVLPAMREAKSGLIINTSSMVGQISAPYFSTYAATKHALEGYVQGLRYEVAPFGIDVAIVQPGPFPTGLSAGGQAPSRLDVLESYGDLAKIPDAMFAEFAKFMQSDQAPDPQLVVDTYLALADMPAGKRPTRTVVGMVWGVDEINAAKQPIQDRVLKEMQLENILGGADA
ncbi:MULTISPECIES: SDR family oxidoreductase [unclassified Pseudomonas]|uniref:SDR family oxidoreductase n=1 Tax=unclassified Pseudomonas TaxID=196821 RepID=UPI0008770238|nr:MULTISPECIES: SDR family oxidoreductase [unclassified Pseudomonas]SCZ22273.1 NADP-dependent 3-hydroxy acid dehydrogenase YdfG [Pseudomonas sp. NFACC44-2]SDA51538.1 NADP-dependent 3-hydroxy acid dehydrogenase YdfG [Pseudomonas sp. NFACC51]SFH20581.1 NADP-dependent 3-hydroxy acid dehydrogenase YdfG [Pseudomonas sp. NFACC54]SFS96629.1 NADP-dependent 3-hydroxy acid dehydrogenase YdfG [Pseudomonas sp. NFACC48-1]